MRWSIGLLALFVLFGCPRVDTGDDGGTGPISAGPQGGLFVRAGYAIDIPPGALSENVQINVTVIDTGISEVSGRKRISFGYRFSPTGLTFSSPATLYLPWVPGRVPMAVDPTTFDMRRQAGADAFLALPGAKTSTLGELSFVEAQTTRLGLFWATSPSEPSIERLEITPEGANLKVGDTQTFNGTVIAPTGERVEVTIRWAVVPPRVGSIDANGVFTAAAPGVATVTASAGAMTATTTVNVFGTSTGPVTYQHENPFPTGNDLWGGAVVPGGLGAIFAGANGTVLAHSLTGEWKRAFSSPAVVLKAVGGTTLENAVAVGALGTSGVLVEFKGASVDPVVTVHRSVEPRRLWFDGTHGMAVGVGNDVLIYRSTPLDAGPGSERKWQTEYSPSFEALLDVVGDGHGGFVTVGARGSIYVWDPLRTVWDSLYQTQLATLLTAAVITTPSGTEAWATGGNKLWHFQGTGWSAENLPTIEGLVEATAMAQVDRHLIIGARLTPSKTIESPGLMLTYQLPAAGQADAGTGAPVWATFPTRNPQIPRGVFGGGIDSPTGYVVGDYGAVYEWQSATSNFTEVSSGFYGDVLDVAALPDDVIASVNTCVDSVCSAQVGRVMHRAPDGGFEPLGPQGFTGPLYGVVARSVNDVLVSASHSTWRWNGAAWATIPTGQSQPILDFKLCDGGVWGAGVGGNVYQGTWELLSNEGAVVQGDLYSLWCPSATELWVAGDGVMASRLPGTTKWAARTSQSVNQAPWRAVWAPGGGEGFAFGVASYGMYWNTATLSAVEPLPVQAEAINALWGQTIDGLYAVGYSTQPFKTGFALRFDGVQWHLVDSGSQRNVTTIDGTSGDGIWLGTEGGGLLRAVPPR